MNDTFMQIFALVNAVILGMIITLAVQHALAHAEQKKAPRKSQQQLEAARLDPAVKQRLLKDAETSFRAILDKSVTSLENDLLNTSAKLHDQLEHFGQSAEAEEAENYRKTIAELHDQAKTVLG